MLSGKATVTLKLIAAAFACSTVIRLVPFFTGAYPRGADAYWWLRASGHLFDGWWATPDPLRWFPDGVAASTWSYPAMTLFSSLWAPVVFSLLGVLFCFLIALEFTGSPLHGFVAGMLYAAYPPLVQRGCFGAVDNEAFAVPLLMVYVWLWVRKTRQPLDYLFMLALSCLLASLWGGSLIVVPLACLAILLGYDDILGVMAGFGLFLSILFIPVGLRFEVIGGAFIILLTGWVFTFKRVQALMMVPVGLKLDYLWGPNQSIYVNENRESGPRDLLTWYGVGLMFFLVGLVSGLREKRRGVILVSVTAAALMAVSVSTVRFHALLAPFLAVSVAYGLWRSQFRGVFLGYVMFALIIPAALVSGLAVFQDPRDPGVIEACAFLASQPSGVVASWWDNGYELQYRLGYPTLCDGSTSSEPRIRLIAEAYSLPGKAGNLKELGASYFIVTQMDLGKSSIVTLVDGSTEYFLNVVAGQGPWDLIYKSESCVIYRVK
jgi:hypothetical protein